MRQSLTLLLVALLLLSSTAYAECPLCYKDQQPFAPNHGYIDGRVKVLVGIQVGSSNGSWANPPGTNVPNQQIATAIGQAMGMWNNQVTDSGEHINYFFDTITGTQPANSVDIVVVKRPVYDSTGALNELAEMETGGTRPFQTLCERRLAI